MGERCKLHMWRKENRQVRLSSLNPSLSNINQHAAIWGIVRDFNTHSNFADDTSIWSSVSYICCCCCCHSWFSRLVCASAHPPGGSVTGHKCVVEYVFIGLFQLVKIFQITKHFGTSGQMWSIWRKDISKIKNSLQEKMFYIRIKNNNMLIK